MALMDGCRIWGLTGNRGHNSKICCRATYTGVNRIKYPKCQVDTDSSHQEAITLSRPYAELVTSIIAAVTSTM